MDTSVTELTSEVGCLARKSVVMRANTMMFLSDDGVYSVEFLNDYNLRGAEEPISKDIQPYIDRLNKDLSNKSVGMLFDNRYYLAVPLDSAPGINDARGNNSILVYNFLNGGWEEVDMFWRCCENNIAVYTNQESYYTWEKSTWKYGGLPHYRKKWLEPDGDNYIHKIVEEEKYNYNSFIFDELAGLKLV